MSLFPGVVLLDIALLYYKRATAIAVMHCHNGREDKLGRGPQTVEWFLLYTTILWRYTEVT